MLTQLVNVPACRVVMEACAGAHWIARRLTAMRHEAKLISPQFVKPFVQGNKNDFADAQAICEAASRPNMRFVSPRNETQQTIAATHRVSEALVRDKTATTNQLHAFLLEFGISLPKGPAIDKRLPALLAEHEAELPPRLIALLDRLREHFKYLDEQIKASNGSWRNNCPKTSAASACWKYPGSARSPPACWPSNWAMPINSPMPARLPRRLAWCLASTAPAANPPCSASANAETRTCDDSSFRGRG